MQMNDNAATSAPDPAAPSGPVPQDPALAEAVRRLSRASVLVVGDAMLDRYIHGEVERVSPEAPVQVLAVQRELTMPGGAGNVVRNLGALDAAVAFVSVVGDDQSGSDLTGLIGGQPGVEPWLLVQGGRTTTVKTRLVAQGQQLLRVDREDVSPIHAKLGERLIRIARDAMAATSVTILSDYRKGIMAGGIAAQLVAAARAAGRPVLVDVHGEAVSPYAGADIASASRRDLALATGLPADDDAAIALAGEALRERHGFGAVLVNRAEEGMTLVEAGSASHFRLQAIETLDVSGAGDCGVATLGAALASGTPLKLAAQLANIASGIAMGRTGTAVVREHDLLAALAPESDNLRKLVGWDAAAGHMERWRRRGWRTGFAQGVFDSLRPGHIHMLQQARSTCDRLVVAVTGDAFAKPRADGRPVQPQAARAARLAAQPVVDLVVIVEEDSPAKLLRLLRPDVLITGGDAAGHNGIEADLLRQWGGRLVQAERLPEPA